MRIATFNIESFDLQASSRSLFEQRINILRPQLERLNADILCLQEVNAQKVPGENKRDFLALDELIKGTVYEDYSKSSSVVKGSEKVSDVHNLVTLSRFRILDSEAICHKYVQPVPYEQVTSKNKDSDYSIEWDRPFLKTRYSLPQNKTLTVLNVHLRSPLASPIDGQKKSPFVWNSVSGWAEGYFISSVKRNGQALEVRLEIDKILEEDASGLIAVCGDFNADDYETALRLVVGAEEDTGNGALADKMLVPVERSVARDQRFSVMHHGKAQMLDHMLVSRSLLGHFQHMEIHNETLGDELVGFAKVDHPPDSYHAPVVAEFSLVDVDWV